MVNEVEYNASKATGVENRAKISHFLTLPEKFRGGVGKMFE